MVISNFGLLILQTLGLKPAVDLSTMLTGIMAVMMIGAVVKAMD
jgi:hypothetical protein